LADIEWKGIIWRAAYGDLSVKELLTILKGFGPMETLEFEKPGSFRGQISLSLSENRTKEITLYHLEVIGPRRQGKGREALSYLKKLFKGELYVEDPGGVIRVKNASEESLPFWIKMYEEGYIDALETAGCSLQRQEADGELKTAAREDSGRASEQ
jgi:hypothetical protein